MLSEKSQSQEATYCMIPFYVKCPNRQIYRERKLIGGFLELGSGKGNRVSFMGDNNFLKKQLYAYFGGVNCMVRELYLHKDVNF